MPGSDETYLAGEQEPMRPKVSDMKFPHFSTGYLFNLYIRLDHLSSSLKKRN
jgi:hypothetical protein